MKKIILVLATALIAGSLCAQDFTYNGIKYSVLNAANKTATTAEGTGSNSRINNEVVGDIEIPEKVVFNNTEYTVTQIGKFSFNYAQEITSVKLPETITTIAQSAFSKCNKLTEINLPDGITSINRNAFEGTRVTHLTIPKGLTDISEYAFAQMSYLNNIIIPDHVKTIGDNAFSTCTFVKTIVIGDGVTKIGEYAFNGCRATTLIIGKNVSRIGNMAFNNCHFLQKIISLNPTPPTTDPWPSSGSYYTFPMEGENYSNAGHILYVPAGSEAAYKNEPGWRKFAYIEAYVPDEDDEPEQPEEPGSMLSASKYVMIKVGETRDFADFFKLRSIEYYETANSKVASLPEESETLSFEDMGKVKGVRYGETVIGAYNLYGELVATLGVFVCPTLTVVYPDGATTEHLMVHNSPVSIAINPSARWRINSVSHDEADVTDKVDTYGVYKSETPVTANSILTVVGKEIEEPTTGAEAPGVDNGIRVSAVGRVLHIHGKAQSEQVEVYNPEGRLILSQLDGTVQLPSAGIYIIRIGDAIYKTAVR